METIISKWGNSPAVRLPRAVMDEAQFAVDEKIRMTVERGRIVIEPLHRVEYHIDALVAGMTAKNRHEEVGFGSPVGREAW